MPKRKLQLCELVKINYPFFRVISEKRLRDIKTSHHCPHLSYFQETLSQYWGRQTEKNEFQYRRFYLQIPLDNP